MSTILEPPTFVLFALLFVGLALGNITIKGVSLGASGVLFAALPAGHLKLQVPAGLSEIGTAFFVYAVGQGVGNRFFSSLRSRGKNLILVALVIVLSGWLTAWCMCLLLGVVVALLPLVLGYAFARKVMRMEMPEILGCCCGSQTSTPALGAITAKTDSQAPVIAYSTAYPVALILMTALAQILVQLA